MIRGAEFSPCRTWRYRLTRIWDATKPAVMFIGLNPSTADESEDDPTVRRCLGYAQRWGHGSLLLCNLFAFRSTQPRGLWTAADPIGPENDNTILKTAKHLLASETPGLVVCAWGNHGAFRDRSTEVLLLLDQHEIRVYALAVTKANEPKHPLYLQGDLLPKRLPRPC